MQFWTILPIFSHATQVFVQTASPLATYFEFFTGDEDDEYLFPMMMWGFQAGNVPFDRLEVIKPTYFQLMRNLTMANFDMDRMRGVIQNMLMSRNSGREKSPESFFRLETIKIFIDEENMDSLAEILTNGLSR